jgi:hypothetical protein
MLEVLQSARHAPEVNVRLVIFVLRKRIWIVD